MSAQLQQAEVFTLQSNEIAKNWPWVERFLDNVERFDWTPEGVRLDLEGGRAQLWGAIGPSGVKGIWITRVENSHSKRWGVVWIASGEPMEEGLELYQKHTEPWFKGQGCESVQIYGRPGWSRVLKGYEEKARVLVKEFQ